MSERPTITQAMIDAYDDYTHLTLDRRGFMEQLMRLAGSGAAAAAIAPLIGADAARAAMVAADDPRLLSEEAAWPGAAGEMRGYLVRPVESMEKVPAVIVIHENRGLNGHIRDVARRVALEGFVALAPDFLSPAGGTPTDEDKAREMIGQLDAQQTTANAASAIGFLRGGGLSTGAVGAVGFCWGGGAVNDLAVAAPELDAGVVFYGRSPDLAKVPRIKARLLIQHAARDTRLVGGLPAYEAALKAAGVRYEAIVYPDVDHAFHNDTSAERYNAAAARLAWERTVAFLAAETGAA